VTSAAEGSAHSELDTAPGPSTGTASAGPQPVRSRGRTVAILVIAVAAIVVVSLALTGVLPLFPAASSTSYTAQAFSPAVSAANNVSASTPGGPWSLRGVQGADTTIPTSIQVGSNCGFQSGSGTESFGSYTGNYSNGELDSWTFLYENPGNTQFLVVEDNGGHASAVGVSSSNCDQNKGSVPVNPEGVIDSPRIATTLLHNLLVERFIASNPIANSSFLLIDLGPPTGWVWEVGYQTCQVGGYGPFTGNDVEAIVNATTGVLNNISSATGVSSCAGHATPTAIGSVFGLFFPKEATCPPGDSYAVNGCQGGDAIYLVGVAYAQSVAHLGNFFLQIETSDGKVLTLSQGVGGFAILNGSTDAVAESTAGPTLSMTGWTFPAGSPANNSTVLENGKSSIVVDLGTSIPYGLGNFLVVNGSGPLSGTFGENLP